MAVKSSSKPAGTRPAPEPQHSGSPVAAMLFTALGVLVIAGCAVLLSYNGVYQIAVQGNVGARYAHLYPAVFTLLVLMALWTSYVLRTAPRSRRLWADGLIVLLVAVAAGASALEAGGLVLVPGVAMVVAAVAPWLALLVAFRLFLSVVMHLRGEVPGTGPRRPRERRRGRNRAEPEDEPEPPRAPAPAEAEEDTRPLDELLDEEPRPQAAAAEAPPLQHSPGPPPRPRAPEPADFRDPGPHPQRPEPADRPSRPERAERPEPPEEPAPPRRRKRPGLFSRRPADTGAGTEEPDEPGPHGSREPQQPADAPGEVDSGSAVGSAPLWPAAAAPVPADRPVDDGDARPTAGAPGAHTRESEDSDEWAWADAEEDSDRAPIAPASGAEAAEAEPGRPAEAEEAADAAADAAGPAALHAVPDTAADQEPAADTAAAAAADSGPLPAGAEPAGDAADTAQDAFELPKREPGAAENPIKRAADAPPTPEPLGAPDRDGGQTASAAAPAHPGEDADGFVHDLPPGDPTNDEAEPGTDAASPSDEPAAEGTGGGGHSGAPGADRPDPHRGDAYPAAPPIEKRPMVLKPRRTPPREAPPREAPSPFPADPPSNRVRSEPKPPEE
ncbi:DUF2637 domain-containing protein [Streptomonospora halophila]|uniref:DUF2637 domain-containing protein n=1 Tax=Streptomonospora halophila TaxID=427369 RepID=UPI0031ED527B